MERGIAMLRWMMLTALAMGGLVVWFHPDYRDTAAAFWKGDVEASPIWETNRLYYTEVVSEADHLDENPE